MKKIIIFIFVTIIATNNVIGQQSWISVDYIDRMKNVLPCECEDSLLSYFYIEIDTVWHTNSSKKRDHIKIALYSPSKTEPVVWKLQKVGNEYKLSVVDSVKETFEQLLVKDDTLYLETKKSNGKYLRMPYSERQQYASFGTVLLNAALKLRGYSSIEELLKVDNKIYDKVSFHCEAWWRQKNLLTIYSTKKKKLFWYPTKKKVLFNPINYILYIKDGYLYIEKALSYPIDHPFDEVKTKFVKKLEWKTH